MIQLVKIACKRYNKLDFASKWYNTIEIEYNLKFLNKNIPQAIVWPENSIIINWILANINKVVMSLMVKIQDPNFMIIFQEE